MFANVRKSQGSGKILSVTRVFFQGIGNIACPKRRGNFLASHLHISTLANLYALLFWYFVRTLVNMHYCGGLLCLILYAGLLCLVWWCFWRTVVNLHYCGGLLCLIWWYFCVLWRIYPTVNQESLFFFWQGDRVLLFLVWLFNRAKLCNSDNKSKQSIFHLKFPFKTTHGSS